MPKISLTTPATLTNDDIEASVIPAEYLLDKGLTDENFILDIPATLYSDVATERNPVIANKIMQNDGANSFYKRVTKPLLNAFNNFKRYSVEEVDFTTTITNKELVGDSNKYKFFSDTVEREVAKPRNYEVDSYHLSWTITQESNGDIYIYFDYDVEDLGDRLKLKIKFTWKGINKKDEFAVFFGKFRILYRVLV